VRGMSTPRRRLVMGAAAVAGLAGLGAAPLAGSAHAAGTALPVPASLRDAGQAAALRGQPLVLLVSLPGCPYCELVRRNYLLPMRAEGLAAWQIDVTDDRQPVRDFADRPSTGSRLAHGWNAIFTPTVLLFNGNGVEVAERLVGVASPDFYGAYLDSALETARRAVSARR